MNRYVRAATAALLVAGGLGSAGCAHKAGAGCDDGTGPCGGGDRMRNAYDTVWPDRYNFAARQATLYPFAQQAANGHFLEQTIWNWHFEPGTDKLNTAGMEKLNALHRRTPPPDPKLYVQAARDLAVTQENQDRIVALRDDLTARRAAAVLRYLTTQPGNPVAYEVAVHDAPTPGIYSVFAGSSFRGQLGGYSGGLSAGGGGAGAAVGGGGSLTAPPGGAAAAPGAAPSGPGY